MMLMRFFTLFHLVSLLTEDMELPLNPCFSTGLYLDCVLSICLRRLGFLSFFGMVSTQKGDSYDAAVADDDVM